MKFLHYLKEVFLSSIPLLAIIVIVNGFIFPLAHVADYLRLGIGYVSVVIGQALFLVGLDKSILPIGKLVGGSVTKLKKMSFVLMFGFLFGLLATAAEPAIAVLAGQVGMISDKINPTIFIWIVSFGTGVSVAFAIFRIIKDINIKVIYTVFYILIFAIIIIAPNSIINEYTALSFDASGATTGDISVPFILALGIGISHTASKRKSNDESFGIIGLASIGPILAVLIYGIIAGPSTDKMPYNPGEISGPLQIILNNLQASLIAVIPIIVVFIIFQFIVIKLPKKNLISILLSSIIVFFGLVIFLSGIDYGFAFAASHIGESFMASSNPDWVKWMLLPIGFVLGFAITLSEPAVVVLGEQVEELTNGHLKKMVIKMSLALSIAIASVLSILKILLNIPITYFLIPLYAIALILLLFTPKLFVGLAFDSGGVTGGAITSAFLTPLTLGASQSLGQDVLSSGLGIIAFISVTPLIVIQILGIIYEINMKKSRTVEDDTFDDELSVLGHDQQKASEDGTI